MAEKNDRFRRLECSPVLGWFKKPVMKSSRFQVLEVAGHKVQVKINAAAQTKKINFKQCPRCGRRSEATSLYCISCDFAFIDAGQVEGSNLEKWEMRCRGCGRVVNRNQASCYYCGWRFKPPAEEPAPQDQGEICVTIDNYRYSSRDANLPLQVRELIARIRKEGYSQELIDNWIKERNERAEMTQILRKEYALSRADYLRQQISEHAWRLIGIAFFVLYLFWRYRLLRF